MISIIVPVYKVEPYLRQCIESVLSQTYKNVEILLIDDGSPDSCGQICEEYAERDGRVRVFHTENKGLSAARNLGFQMANGEYIGFVDADDWIEPNMYETLLERLVETNSDICICAFWFEYVNTFEEEKYQNSIMSDKDSLKALIRGEIKSYVWNKLFKRNILENVLFPEGKNFEDISNMYGVLRKSDVITVTSDPKYHYRQRKESISKSFAGKNLCDFADACLERYFFYKKELEDIFYEEYDSLLLSVARGISRLWRWWYGVDRVDKEHYKEKIKELKTFTKEQIPLFGYKSWPAYLRISSFFMHSDSWLSFAVLYGLNQAYRKLRPDKMVEFS